MPPEAHTTNELDYVILLFALFVVPRLLQRYRIPTALTNLALGIVAGIGLSILVQDRTIALLSTLGIVSLFLFAGLDVSPRELRRGAAVLVQHIAVGVVALVVVAIAAHWLLGLPGRPAMLVSLALLTPSTGFILDTLPSLELTESQRFWAKSKAVGSELVALGVLFVTLRSTTAIGLASSTLILAVMIWGLPFIFRLFAAWIAPYAPKSEFAFLLMIAVLCAFVTRRLGVYYLVGAFVVGIAAQRFRERLPAIASDQMLHAVEVFASVFVPFYFFNAGLHLRAEDFGADALLTGLAFIAIIIPLRIALVVAHRRWVLREPIGEGVRVGVALLPSLVFTLVIAEILRDRYIAPRAVFGGLIIYTLVNTLLPGFFLRVRRTVGEQVGSP